jgi:homoserine kinase
LVYAFLTMRLWLRVVLNVSPVTVSVPATTANIGPGFDCLGAALTRYNRFVFSSPAEIANLDPPLQINAVGPEADRVHLDQRNLVYQAFLKLFQTLGQAVPPVHIEIHLGVPLARGLGSSATAIVGGLVGANALAGSPLTQAEIGNLAISLEGHPDNVIPALLGGCQLSATHGEDWEICPISWHPSLVPIVAIPNFELSTAEARRVLPTQYSRADAVFNTAHLGLLLRGLETGNPNWLAAALDDRIHQPYRQSLIPGYAAVAAAARQAGALGLVISGAGPTLLALALGEMAAGVQAAMAQAWATAGIQADVETLAIAHSGTTVH